MEPKTQIIEKNIVDNVLNRVTTFQKTGELRLPENYSAENALKSAYLILQETMDRDKKPVLQVCTKESVANTLLDMVVQGLSPMKKQCYFIPYGNKLTLQRSYQGSVAIAKRVGLKNIIANVVYDGDKFSYAVEPDTGLKKLITHEQVLENIDIKKIKGVYAITEMEDGRTDITLMTISQVRAAWNQGFGKGTTNAHINFTDEMAKKTVISRACKNIINSSDDSYLHLDDDQIEHQEDIMTKANSQVVDFEDADVVGGLPADNEGSANPEPEPVQYETIYKAQMLDAVQSPDF